MSQLPDRRFEYPSLLDGTRPDEISLEIDWDHPLAKGLVFFVVPKLLCTEIVTGDLPTVSTGANASIEGEVHYDSVTFNDLLAFPHPKKINDISVDYSLVWSGVLKSLEDYGAIFQIPYRVSTWTTPFMAIGMDREGTTDSLNATYAINSSTLGSAISTSGFIVTGASHRSYVISRTGSTFNFYRDSILHSTTVGTADPVDFGTEKPDILLMRKSVEVTGEASTGTTRYAALYSRGLSIEEITILERDPYQFIVQK